MNNSKLLLQRTAVMSAIIQTQIIKLDWTLNATAIRARAAQTIAQSKASQDQVAAVPVSDRTFNTVIAPLAHSEGGFIFFKLLLTIIAHEATASASCYFPQYVSADKATRDASIEANKLIETHEIDSGMREDVYAAVKTVWDQCKESSSAMPAEDHRLVRRLELMFRRNGLALCASDRTTFMAYKKRLSDLCIDFSKNINEDKTSVDFTLSQLEGLPKDFIDGLKQTADSNNNKYYSVTMQYPDLFPMLNSAKLESTRKAMDIANSTRCKSNVQLLEEAVKVREKCAHLLGYKNHAEFTLEERMAKSPSQVAPFLDDLAKQLKPLAERDLDTLLRLKKSETGAEFDGQINSWDFRYYNHLLVEREYQVNEELIKEFFPVHSVTQNMLALYERVLGLKFSKIEHPSVWHEDVQLYAVNNSQDDSLVGHFYLDLFPREGKYTHAACFGLQPGCQLEDGSRQYPVAAMVANFSKPTADRPSLLKHNEVVTYYHELGHVMHQLCSITKWCRFHGTHVERDFVEAPSQMLENWCWEADVLAELSAHYKKIDSVTGKPERIPTDLCNKLVATKNVNAGLMNLRQIFFAKFDMQMHTAPADHLDSSQLYDDLRKNIALIPNAPDTFPAATFGHVMGGYDAGYYGYLWSQVFSADMFYSRFKKEGVQNADVGRDYRKHILQPGGSVDGGDMLQNFLGRKPSSDAFLTSIGL